MSIAAISWAFQVRTGSPLGKLVLLLLADIADEDKIAVIEPHLFASRCDMSLDELKEGLRQLLRYELIQRVESDRIIRQTQVAYFLTGEVVQ